MEALDAASCKPESIVLREFEVSDYMASALGRLEKYRGNATLHGFLYSIDHSIQSFNIVYYKTASCDVKSRPVRLKRQKSSIWMI